MQPMRVLLVSEGVVKLTSSWPMSLDPDCSTMGPENERLTCIVDSRNKGRHQNQRVASSHQVTNLGNKLAQLPLEKDNGLA